MDFLPLLSHIAVNLCGSFTYNLMWEYVNVFFLHVSKIKSFLKTLSLCIRPIITLPQGLFSAFSYILPCNLKWQV